MRFGLLGLIILVLVVGAFMKSIVIGGIGGVVLLVVLVLFLLGQI